MKRRITFVQRPDAPFQPHQAVLTPTTLSIRDLDAVREDRLTIGVDDLPEELRAALQLSHELHLRWATERAYDAVAPFASRISPGLHVHFTPLVPDQSSDALCSLLRTAFGTGDDGRFGVNCSTPEDSFITPSLLSTRFAASASLQFYTRLPSLQSLVTFIRRTVCQQAELGGTECRDRADSLLSADSVDIDYDSISHTLTVTGLWAHPSSARWTEEIQKPASGADQVEFGLLGAEEGTDPGEIKMGGLLAVVGTDKKLKPTVFSFPSRHHPLPEPVDYTVSFPPPTGLHPTLSISMPRSSLQRPPAPREATCALHTYLTLPSSVFGDQYQLATSDPLFLQSHNLVALRAVAGETDLEAPDWAVPRWGSTWLLELATPPPEENSDPPSTPSNWTVTVPLHLRYGRPSESGYRSTHVPWPVVFWACTADDGTKMGVNPFDRTNLGWDGLFGPRTMFYQLHPASDRLVEDLAVPVLRLTDGEGLFHARNIERGTCAAIILGFLWVLWRLVRVAWSTGLGPNRSPRRAESEHDKKE